MSTHDKRMKDLSRIAIPPKGSPAREHLEKIFALHGKNPEVQNDIKLRWEHAKALLIAQQENGAGFELDQTLRYFAREYSNRVITWDLHSLPASFNVMEAYTSYSMPYAIFQLRKEKDHLFSFDHFLEWVTEPDFKLPIEDAIECFESGVIYNYTNTDPQGRTTFSSSGTNSFAIGGFSIIRHGLEISVMLLGGERMDLKAKTEELQSIGDGSSAPGKEEIRPSAEYVRRAEPLKGTTDFWKVLAITRFDLSDRTQQIRYILHDCGDSFSLLTDDPSPFLDEKGDFIDSQYVSDLEEYFKRVTTFETLFELCTTSIFLGAYFDHFGDDIVEERHKTALAEKINLLSFRNTKKLIPPSERIAYRTVSSLRTPEDAFQNKTTSYLPPRFRMESSGYWKQLGVGEIGADKHGNEIHGRTWVYRKLSWVQTVKPMNPVRVSSSSEHIPSGPNSGFIYVMRSAIHQKNVFKVGLTQRSAEKRSEELSRETGSPDRFYVMQEWAVSDCIKAEKIIHDRLDFYRLNPKREFFELDYRELFAVIDEITKEINKSGVF